MINLESQGSNEYQGKLIELNGCKYSIGPLVTVGSSYIIHRLINNNSGLCQHVVKIVKDTEEEKDSWYLKEPPYQLAKLYKHVLYFFRLETPLGVLLIQRALAPHLPYYEDINAHTDEIMSQAENLQRSSQLNEASLLYEKVLEINPLHTVALNNLAIILANSGAYNKALQLCERAVSIEPNCLEYHQTSIKLATQCDFLLNAIEKFESMKNHFPYNCDLDELGIICYLESGKPELAKEFIKRAFLLSEDKRDAFLKNIERDVALKNSALGLVKSAEDSLSAKSCKIVGLNVLEQAHQVYDKDPLIAINLGFALRENGEYIKGKQILLSMVHKVPYPTNLTCILNAGFCDVEASNYDSAIELFDAAMQYILSHFSGRMPIQWSDIPSSVKYVRFFGGLFMEIETDRTGPYALVKRAIEHYTCEKDVPDTVMKLAELYKQKKCAGHE